MLLPWLIDERCACTPLSIIVYVLGFIRWHSSSFGTQEALDHLPSFPSSRETISRPGIEPPTTPCGLGTLSTTVRSFRVFSYVTLLLVIKIMTPNHGDISPNPSKLWPPHSYHVALSPHFGNHNPTTTELMDAKLASHGHLTPWEPPPQGHLASSPFPNDF